MLNRCQFSLFQTPIDLAHAYWKQLLQDGDSIIDATCGNGHDTLFLAQCILKLDKKGKVIAIDKQSQAIENTQDLLKKHLSYDLLDVIAFYTQCHSSFPSHLEKESQALIVYNLGYLPGGNKAITTHLSTTLQSLECALSLIRPGGAISITCYPGHDAGKIEEEALLKFAAALAPETWSCCHHRWMNRQNAPSLLLIQRGVSISTIAPSGTIAALSC